MTRMMELLREGDEVVVWRLDRIARSVSHLCKLVETWEKIGIQFKSLQEPFIDTTSAQGKFVFILFGAVAQLERDILIERTNAGLAAARKRGRTGGRKPGLSKEAEKKAIIVETLYKAGKMTIAEICLYTGIGSKSTIYSYLKHRGVTIDGYTTQKKIREKHQAKEKELI